jgi:hypothetical protein
MFMIVASAEREDPRQKGHKSSHRSALRDGFMELYDPVCIGWDTYLTAARVRSTFIS